MDSILASQVDTRMWLELVLEETIPQRQRLADYLSDGNAL